eukprot:m.216857 g.216857  ORF g.216857 m.216857 type:complete len:73 (+) comp18661_c4_seq1:463-681(+)
MGNCFGTTEQPTPEELAERRRMQAAAAERRQQESSARGLKDPNSVARKQEAKARAQESARLGEEAPLKWQVS